MAVTLGGSHGVTYPDASNTPATSVTARFTPYITDTANVMVLNRGVVVDGTNGITTPLGVYVAATFAKTITTDQANLNLRTWALANGWDGSSPAIITVGSGVYIYSTSTANAGLIIDGSWPGGVTVINNGYIMGQGGNGSSFTGSPGTSPAATVGGPAISLGVNCSITNNSYIGGGGGGGGMTGYGWGGGGGGAGGGAGGNAAYGAGGGGGGGLGGAGGTGTVGSITQKGGTSYTGGGGGGGRAMPGTGGAGGASGGGGGVGGTAGGGGGGGNGRGGNAGGSAGTAGGGGGEGAGGGGWGASGGTAYWNANPNYLGAAGGKAIALNGYTATRTGSGTTYGAVS